MFRKISDALHRHANGRSLLLFLALMVLFAAVIVPTAQGWLKGYSGGVDLIDLMLAYSPDTVYRMIGAYGDEGRSLYRNFALSADLVYPVVYSTFLSLVISWQLQRATAPDSKLRMLNLLPFGAMLFDWLENACVVTMLSFYPTTSSAVARIASMFTSLKWTVSAASLLLVLALAVPAARYSLRERT